MEKRRLWKSKTKENLEDFEKQLLDEKEQKNVLKKQETILQKNIKNDD